MARPRSLLPPPGTAHDSIISIDKTSIVRWRKRPLGPHNGNSDSSGHDLNRARLDDVKGKGKAPHYDEDFVDGRKGKHRSVEQVSPHVLLQQSFTLYKLSPLHHFPSSSSSTELKTWSQKLLAYLTQQLGPLSGFTDPVPINGAHIAVTSVTTSIISSLGSIKPLLVRIHHLEDSNSNFILLPCPTASRPTFPLLLAKSASPHLTQLMLNYLSTRHDSHITPHRLSPQTMLCLFESVMACAPTSADQSTCLTFAFPSQLASEGLSSMTVTLAPSMITSLLSTPSLDRRLKNSNEKSTLLDRLSNHIESLTSLPLNRMTLIKFGAGKGTWVHSGISSTGPSVGGGAKVKFVRSALGAPSKDVDAGEVQKVLSGLMQGI